MAGGQSVRRGRIRKVKLFDEQRRWLYKIKYARGRSSSRPKIAKNLGLGSIHDEGQVDMWKLEDV